MWKCGKCGNGKMWKCENVGVGKCGSGKMRKCGNMEMR
jgi:hypothetical protein